MSPSKGYLIPEVVAPTENEYIIVSVPAHEGHRRAFWGAMQRLGYWWAWERDPLKQGKDCAARWRESIAETLELWEEIGSMSPLTINVNCSGNSGGPLTCNNLISFNLDLAVHVGQEVIDDINALPGGNVDQGEISPIPGYSYAEYRALKCAYANQMATDIHNSWDNFASLGFSAAAMSFPSFAAMLSSGAFAASLVGLLGGIVTAGTLMTAALGALVGIGTVFGLAAYQYFETLQQKMDIDTLRCALYGATNAEEARERVASTFYAWGVEAALLPIASGALLDAFVNLARMTAPVSLLEPLFDETPYALSLPVADCSACVDVIPDPAPTGDATLKHYILFNANITEVDDVTGTQIGSVGGVSLAGGLWGNNAILFDTDGEYMRSSNPGLGNLQPGSGDYSVVLWFSPQEGGDSTPFIGKYNSGSDKTWSFTWVPSTQTLIWQHATSINNWFGPSSAPYGPMELLMWHFVCITYDLSAQQITMRTNGSAYVEQSLPNIIGMRQSNNPFDVGGWVNRSFWSRVAVQELAIFNGILTAEQQEFLFNGGQGRPATSL